MSLLWSRRGLGDTLTELVPVRSVAQGTVTITPASALQASAVWACLMLRANLISTLPLDAFRSVERRQVEVPKTPFLLNPGGDQFGATDWLFSSQMDLDRIGNVFGLIRAFDAAGRPAVVELVPFGDVTVKGKGAHITGYRVGSRNYTPDEVWHERQYTIPGVPLGLSPIGHAAMSIGSYLSAQRFALDWFSNGSVPSGRLKNTQKTITTDQALEIKDRFKAAVAGRDLFVHGADWEYSMLQVPANESQFLESMNFGVLDITRFFGVPSDLIDAPAQSSAKITYANITQRHLQLLVVNLGPVIVRREAALSATLPQPRFVKFNTDAFLRMDTQSREMMFGQMIRDRMLAPSEARAMDNRLPFTDAQLAEFDRLFSSGAPQAQTPPAAKDGVPA